MNAYPFTTWIAPGIALPAKYEVRWPSPRPGMTQRAWRDATYAADTGGPAEPAGESEVSVAHVAFSSLVALASVLLVAFAR
jgi:hypothetical protein